MENAEDRDLANEECETPVFLAEQERHFQTRYEEGYDLPDLVYRGCFRQSARLCSPIQSR